MRTVNRLFQSFLQAGFECSTHWNRNGKRLDLLASTQHDCFAAEDFDRVRAFGLSTVRTSLRWHLIERTRGSYDFSSIEEVLNVADAKGIEVILDILHFGWPDFVDVFSPEFLDDFNRFTFAVARYLARRGTPLPYLAPVNEVSYLSWAGGEKGCIGPFETNRGHELKKILICAAANACKILLRELPGVRLLAPEPVIHIVGNPAIPGDEEEATRYTYAMYESWDMLSGRMDPELGGRPEYLDIIGVNFYERNEWIHNSLPITRDHPQWRPFRDILIEVWERYRRPLMVSETGTEDDARPGWLHYICNEVRAAMRHGVPVHGICLYPILNHPGWDDDRHCCNGLFDYADEVGNREVYQPLANAILAEQRNFKLFFEEGMTHKPELDLICLSHLRWSFVFQRPQHLMTRFAKQRRVFFVEEPVFENGPSYLRISVCEKSGVRVCTPVLPFGLTPEQAIERQRIFLESIIVDHGISNFVLWYYTPIAREFSRHLNPAVTVYDCMDELSAFAGAPTSMQTNELDLFRHAQIVFTGGASLFESKKRQHPSVHLFPSSVDVAHFGQARASQVDPLNQQQVPFPRIGYAGVLDERLDLDLLREAAQLRPDYHFVLIGPICKIDPASLPQAPNIHYLGMQNYADLPAYLSGWQIGMLPFALNESTRYISPTKTPEYLAAGLRVISTPIRDVVTPYGDLGLTEIASTPAEFVEAADYLLQHQHDADFRAQVDAFLSKSSWDKTWSAMNELITKVTGPANPDSEKRQILMAEGLAHV